MSPDILFPSMWYVRPAKGSDQPAHMRSLIRAFASCLNFYHSLATDQTSFGVSKLKKRLHRVLGSLHVKMTHLWISHVEALILLSFPCNYTLFACFADLRPKSTAMVMVGRSVHLTTLFPGQA